MKGLVAGWGKSDRRRPKTLEHLFWGKGDGGAGTGKLADGRWQMGTGLNAGLGLRGSRALPCSARLPALVHCFLLTRQLAHD